MEWKKLIYFSFNSPLTSLEDGGEMLRATWELQLWAMPSPNGAFNIYLMRSWVSPQDQELFGYDQCGFSNESEDELIVKLSSEFIEWVNQKNGEPFSTSLLSELA